MDEPRLLPHFKVELHYYPLEGLGLSSGFDSRTFDLFAGILEPGLTDYIVLQIPTGDMTLDEAKRTMDIFCSDVKPSLEAAA